MSMLSVLRYLPFFLTVIDIVVSSAEFDRPSFDIVG
jgi:hypothetical protein